MEKKHVEEFVAHLAETRSAATASVRYRALQQWFAWMAEEEEIAADPMARMRPPIVPEQPVPVLESAQLQALLVACEGKEFADRRDAALVHLFLDTGVRLAELTEVTLDDIDLEARDDGHGQGPARSHRGVRHQDRPRAGPVPAHPGTAQAGRAAGAVAG